MSLLKIENLSFRNGSKTIIDNLTLHIRKNETLGLLGCNGAGKTTLFDLICGIKNATHGRIINHSKTPAYLTQIITPPPLLRMSEVGKLICNLNSNTPPTHPEILSRLTQWSPSLSKRYADISQKKASTCSYGEIRSFFALTLLLLNNDLIILDEPTAGVDPEFRHYIWLGINNACQEGASVLISSHYTEEITTNCHRFYMLANRRAEAFNSGEEFMARHRATSLDEAFVNASL
ncbi:ATP-binding cassette domain-containing protein [Pseudomonas sp. BR1R-5]|uniref:ATP-binding cassette domain-containing protein n=1 Tax=Pseudomonas sp. BR1R-5 TaxID=3003626 RepID=UPI002491B24C|nr:ATP-binding cassette domain-containing protein [Pseudomonas sp. BR1R-5]